MKAHLYKNKKQNSKLSNSHLLGCENDDVQKYENSSDNAKKFW